MANNLGIGIKVKASTDQATSRVNRLSNATAKATGNFKSHQVALHKSSARMIQLSKDANRTSDSLLHLSNNSNKLTNALKFGAGVASLRLLGRAISGFVAEHTNMAMSAIETNNLFEVSFGKMAEEVEGKIRQISQATGLNETAMKNISGTYNMLARSMGFNSEQAGTLSMNVMKLGYDLSSLTNVPIDQVMQDLRSGLLGQSETVYKYGIDVTEAALKQEALNQGISKSVREMSQGEKMYLRQIVMLRQTGLAHGDFAKTIEQPANQLRLLQQRFATLSETIGKLFIPVLAWILPIANAVVMVLNDMVNAIGRFFGIDMETSVKKTAASAGAMSNSFKATVPKINDVGKASDRSLGRTKKNIDKTGKSADDTSKKIKKMAQALLGIDEINTLKQPDADSPDTSIGDTGIGDIGGIGGIDGIADSLSGLGGVFGGLPLDEFSNGLENIRTKADELRDAFWLNLNEIKAKMIEVKNSTIDWLSTTEVFGEPIIYWLKLFRDKIIELKNDITGVSDGVKGIKLSPETKDTIVSIATAVLLLASAFMILTTGGVGLPIVLIMFALLNSELLKLDQIPIVGEYIQGMHDKLVPLATVLAVVTTAFGLMTAISGLPAIVAGLTNFAVALEGLQGLPIIGGFFQFLADKVLWLGVQFDAIAKLIAGLTMPALFLLIAIVALVVGAIVQLWHTSEEFRNTFIQVFNNIATLLMTIWTSLIYPIFDAFISTLLLIWHGGLKPLWAAFVNIIEQIMLIIGDLLNFIIPVVTLIIKYLGPIIGAVLKGLGLAFAVVVDVIVGVMSVMGNVISVVISKVRDILKGITTFLTGAFSLDWRKSIDGINKIFEGFGLDFSAQWEGLKKIANGFITFFKGVFSLDMQGATNGLMKILEGLVTGFMGIFKTPINFIIDMINTLIKGANKFKIDIPAWAAKIMGLEGGSFGINIPLIPKLARGGMLDGGQAFIAGEGGFKELLGSHQGKTTVMPLENTDFVRAVQDAVFSGVVNAMGQTGDGGDVVLQVSSSELGRIAIDSINKVTRQEGRLLLQV